ncbi:MAG TPA: hypothetical protein VH637_12715 [Streptosporangiaceae bacterium]|jgi:hypothetical protein
MWRDDDELLAALAGAVREAQAVPREFVEAGKAAYAWRTIDAELAALIFDSAAGAAPGAELAPAGTRAEPAVLRGLTFTSARLTIEVQIGADGLLGQIAPPQPGEAEVQLATGTQDVVAIDPIGWFALRPAPGVAFRLRLRTRAGEDVLTCWVTP